MNNYKALNSWHLIMLAISVFSGYGCIPHHDGELADCVYAGKSFENSHYIITSDCWEESEMKTLFSGKIPEYGEAEPVKVEIIEGPVRELEIRLVSNVGKHCMFSVWDVQSDVLCESMAPSESIAPICSKKGKPSACSINLQSFHSKMANY